MLHLLNSYIYFGKHPFWKYINATDFTNGVAGDLIERHRSILEKEAQRLTNESKTA